MTILQTAVRHNDFAVVSMLIEAGASTNGPSYNQDSYDWSPLYTATTPGMVRFLVNLKADVNQQNDNGESYIQTQIDCGFGMGRPNPEIVRALVECRADINKLCTDRRAFPEGELTVMHRATNRRRKLRLVRGSTPQESAIKRHKVLREHINTEYIYRDMDRIREIIEILQNATTQNDFLMS